MFRPKMGAQTHQQQKKTSFENALKCAENPAPKVKNESL